MHSLSRCLHQPKVVSLQIIRFAFNLEPKIRAEALGKFKSLTRSFRMALAADYHHTHTLNVPSAGYQTKTPHPQNLQLFPNLLEEMKLVHLAHKESVVWHKES